MAKKIEQDVELWNVVNEGDVKSGKQEPLLLKAKVDNGSVFTVLPQRIADQLDLVDGGKVWVRYADERRARRRKVKGLCIRIPGIPDREITTDALVEPKRKQVLLGCEELERLDLIADHKAGVLRPSPGTEKGITFSID